jgi:hypothetical protein
VGERRHLFEVNLTCKINAAAKAMGDAGHLQRIMPTTRHSCELKSNHDDRRKPTDSLPTSYLFHRPLPLAADEAVKWL